MVRNKILSRFYKLELLVSKLVKAFCLSSSVSFALLLGTWDNLDFAGASTVRSMFFSGAKFDDICSALAKARKLYCSSKLLESKHTEESHIRQAITNRIKSFKLDKGCTIRSVLERPFRKVVLDYLVMDNELVLEPDLVKSKVDAIIERWTRKHVVVDDISNTWSHQYQPLDYIFNNAFSEVMSEIDFDELHHVITNFPDEKAAGLSGISNELWKHCDKSVLVLKNTTTQSPIFVVGLVIEDALEKNWELWLVLQNMQKVYDLRLDLCGLVPEWFGLSVAFLTASHLSSTASVGAGPLNFYESDDFMAVCGRLSQVNVDSLSVYMDGSLKNLGTVDCRAGAAVFFEDINLGLGVSTIVLALEYVPAACSIDLFSDSQAALNAYRFELSLRQHIQNVIHSKNLRVSWHKVKGYSSVSGNDHADSIADAVFLSSWYLSLCIDGHFLLADSGVVFGNSRHFVRDVYYAVCHAYWKVGSGSGFLASNLCSDVDWLSFSRVWYPNLNMATGFISRLTADTHTYLMKTLHYQLPVAVQKHIYDKYYTSVLCLYCGEVEISDHVFSCAVDDSARH
ncbi:hypothetical protein G9A89_006554 [Geosiphon pyriformis]|nr:hypothetical protein G9A89_006554 [Geosiphon pyriformis]